MANVNRSGDFILSEGNGNISREEITIEIGAGVLEAGQILGKVTASGKYKAYDGSANDGTEEAVGVLYAQTDATSADAKAVAIVRQAEVKEDKLIDLDNDAKEKLVLNQIVLR